MTDPDQFWQVKDAGGGWYTSGTSGVQRALICC